MIEVVNENIGRKVKVIGNVAHYLLPGSIATIREFSGGMAEVKGVSNCGKPLVQYLTADDYEFVEDDNDDEE